MNNNRRYLDTSSLEWQQFSVCCVHITQVTSASLFLFSHFHSMRLTSQAWFTSIIISLVSSALVSSLRIYPLAKLTWDWKRKKEVIDDDAIIETVWLISGLSKRITQQCVRKIDKFIPKTCVKTISFDPNLIRFDCAQHSIPQNVRVRQFHTRLKIINKNQKQQAEMPNAFSDVYTYLIAEPCNWHKLDM